MKTSSGENVQKYEFAEGSLFYAILPPGGRECMPCGYARPYGIDITQ